MRNSLISLAAPHNPGRLAIEDALASRETSFWLSSSLMAAVLRDPVDAVNDAEVLLLLLQKWLSDQDTHAS